MFKKNLQNKSVFEINIAFKGVTLAEKILFAKHLAIMLRSGISITEALEISIESTKGKMKDTMEGVSSSVQAGHTLADSLEDYPKIFSNFFVNVTRAGESSGTLTENLDNISETMRKEKELISKIKGALLYPIIILIVAFVLGMFLSFIVLPRITPLFEGLKVDLPATTRALIWFSHFIQNYGMLLFLGIIISTVLIIWSARQKFSRPFTHWLLLKTPIIKNLVYNTNLSRFSHTLGMLIKSGVNIDEALIITRATVGNYYFQNALENVGQRVAKGVRLSQALAGYPHLFPKILTQMIRVGEESRKFEDTLFYLANMYEEEVDTSTKSLSTAIEPILLIFIGLTVGFLTLSIITPIYDITGNIKR